MNDATTRSQKEYVFSATYTDTPLMSVKVDNFNAPNPSQKKKKKKKKSENSQDLPYLIKSP